MTIRARDLDPLASRTSAWQDVIPGQWAQQSGTQHFAQQSGHGAFTNPLLDPVVMRSLQMRGMHPDDIQHLAHTYENFHAQHAHQHGPLSYGGNPGAPSATFGQPVLPEYDPNPNLPAPPPPGGQMMTGTRRSKSDYYAPHRAAGMQEVLRIAAHLARSGEAKVAQALYHGARNASAIDTLYRHPRTRTASGDGVARKAMRVRIANTLAVADYLAARGPNGRDIADRLVMATYNSYLYPRS